MSIASGRQLYASSSQQPLDISSIEKLFKKAMTAYQPGGSFEKAAYEDIETGKKQAVGSAVQGLVSAGMAGSSLMGSVPLIAEKSAAKSRINVSAERERGLSGIQVTLATLIAQLQEAERQRQWQAGQSASDRSLTWATSQPRPSAATPYISSGAATPSLSSGYSSTVPSAPNIFGGGGTTFSGGSSYLGSGGGSLGAPTTGQSRVNGQYIPTAAEEKTFYSRPTAAGPISIRSAIDNLTQTAANAPGGPNNLLGWKTGW